MDIRAPQKAIRKILHIDMDCFFAAIEMRDNPSLKNIPLAVGGSAQERGVICTANYPARKFGVSSALATATALKRCPNLTLLPVRMDYYAAVSAQIHAIYKRYTSIIEPLSLDEAFLDVSSCTHCRGSATLLAQQIRQEIHQELQLTASAGAAPVKFLAKIASDINKPNGQFILPPEQVQDFLSTLPLNALPGIGKVTASHLERLGLHTCYDVQQFSLAKLTQEFGKQGLAIWEYCHGIDESPVVSESFPKSVGVERTLPQDINRWEDCAAIVESLYVELRVRVEHLTPKTHITGQGVKIKFHDFQQTTKGHTRTKMDKDDLLEQAFHVWQERRNGRRVRLVGLYVVLHDPHIPYQLLLPDVGFTPPLPTYKETIKL